MNVLLVNSSPKQHQSSSYILVQGIVKQLAKSSTVEVDEVDVTKLPHIDADYASALCTPDGQYDQTVGSLSTSNQLIASLEAADMVIIASPMHNYSLPSGLKCWIDHVVRAGKTFELTSAGKHPLLNDKPVYILISSGGVFSGEQAYQPDFFTPYMTQVLAAIGLNNVHFFTIEGTAASGEIVQQKIESMTKHIQQHLATTLI
ncbi:NAD(P)H-dependent oxidoreductase [Vibrio sp. S11_S32]|uniref:FMN-dependent NADH-azoreductase n=1 Tax=Vibrio sp. S11_S32 TaxID=2720225 RepID=UPI001680D76E|nr:NAD(P)H-dependent oxidoreductase [Vibrio sp. S11_S32]MBD1577035.1 NAD(P)H-dependent oxidoreductase [Vibrio sp. S11_S32]